MAKHSALASHLGVLARDGTLAPLNYTSWRWVPKHCKKMIWDEILANTNATQSMRTFFMKSIGKKWRDWKAEAKKERYMPFNNDADRLGHKPSRVIEQQWGCLVYFWGSRSAQDMSDKNKQIRQNQVLLHTTGRTPHCVIEQKEKQKRGASPSRAEMFIITRTKKDGKPVNDAAGEAMAKLTELRESNGGNSEARTLDDEGIFTQVMGLERPGRVRGYGLGPTPSQIFGGPSNGQSQSSSQSTTSPHVEQRLQSLESFIGTQNETIGKQNEIIKQMARALQACGIPMDLDALSSGLVPHKQAPDASSAHHNVVGSHHDSDSGLEPQVEVQTQTQMQVQQQPQAEVQSQMQMEMQPEIQAPQQQQAQQKSQVQPQRMIESLANQEPLNKKRKILQKSTKGSQVGNVHASKQPLNV